MLIVFIEFLLLVLIKLNSLVNFLIVAGCLSRACPILLIMSLPQGSLLSLTLALLPDQYPYALRILLSPIRLPITMIRLSPVACELAEQLLVLVSGKITQVRTDIVIMGLKE